VSHIEKRIVLIDGPMLANLMLDHNVGVTTANSYTLQRLDLFFQSGQRVTRYFDRWK
jgi:restriction endonuclease Mrr